MTPPRPPAFEKKLSLDKEALAAFLDKAFPPAARPSYGQIESVALDHVRMTLEPRPEMIRPGDIVAGPALMGLADVAAYAVVLAHLGPVAMAVTNSLTINFLRPCQLETIMADARLLRLGRRLATVEVRLWQGREDRLVAVATVGYALP
ncbi:MAG TPA: PaaI family thioesterase [Hypericibacter adhaerens]|jgi:uncharacterized protein (TIGR00369 family)|uniref:Thioesterase n=1 Tax=Hypericibacter adhaerens TaxID=2602016 RepID=A0A5J6MZS6_9PROT|nr:PaaI family thioesterase [Hypericibacter adhaerens]QEX20176.1 thioesterase [Hypericibacter adhaerens]HWA44052.1 PaaI family thioesterase [Hypericibacter adhaerens]